jgi:DNA-binding MarR family transcriptional regulator
MGQREIVEHLKKFNGRLFTSGQIADEMGLTRHKLSKQLNILVAFGLIWKDTSDWPRIYYSYKRQVKDGRF